MRVLSRGPGMLFSAFCRGEFALLRRKQGTIIPVDLVPIISPESYPCRMRPGTALPQDHT
jgi:hypothetical protein